MVGKRYYAIEGVKIGFVTCLVLAVVGLFSGNVNSFYILGAVLMLVLGSGAGALTSVIISNIDQYSEPGGIVGMVTGMLMAIFSSLLLPLLLIGATNTLLFIGALIEFGIIGLIVGLIIKRFRR